MSWKLVKEKTTAEQLFFEIPGEVVMHPTYHYNDCGLDNVYLLNGFRVVERDDETYYGVSEVDQLHQLIAIASLLNLIEQDHRVEGTAEHRFAKKVLK